MGRLDGVVIRILSLLIVFEFVIIFFIEFFSFCIIVFMFYVKIDVLVEYIWSL